MNFKKIVAVVATAAMALSAFSFSASAADPTVVQIVTKDATSWQDTVAEVEVNGDGTYTGTVDLSAINPTILGYIWVYGVEDTPADYANATLTIDSVKINGTEWPLVTTSVALINPATAPVIGERTIMNVWNEPNNMLDMTNTSKSLGNGYSFLDADGAKIAVSSVEVTFTLSGVGAAAAPAATTAPATGNTPIAIIGGIAVAGLIGTVVSRKRK
jgi:hypothetical protein